MVIYLPESKVYSQSTRHNFFPSKREQTNHIASVLYYIYTLYGFKGFKLFRFVLTYLFYYTLFNQTIMLMCIKHQPYMIRV